MFSRYTYLLAAALLASCEQVAAPRPLIGDVTPDTWDNAVRAAFVGADGGVLGSLSMTDATGGVLLRIDVTGLSEGWHGVHIHEVGDCSDGDAGFAGSGGHVNPEEYAHGLLNPEGPKRANLPNIHATDDGRATAEFYRNGVTLAETEASIAADSHVILDADGFAIVIHAAPDDHKSQPIGGSGARVACAAVTN